MKKSDLQILKDFVRHSDLGSTEPVSLSSSMTAVGRVLFRIGTQIVHGVKGTLYGHDKHLPAISAGPGRKRGRQAGSISDPEDEARLDRLDELWDDETVPTFTDAVRQLIEEEGSYEPTGKTVRRLRIHWERRHPTRPRWRNRHRT